MERRGPLLLRAAHQGALLLLAGAVQFTVAMAIVQARYPGYSDVHNAISDLGNSSKSPWYLLFNASIIVLGLLGLFATYLLRTAFRPRTTSRIGLVLLAITFLGAIGVGASPENVDLGLHEAFSLVTFVGIGLTLIVLAVAMLRDTRWEHWRLYSAVSGAVTLGATIVITTVPAAETTFFGLVERIIVAPGLLWAALTGIRLARIPVYDPTGGRAPGAGTSDSN